jgi:hypothetical protein
MKDFFENIFTSLIIGLVKGWDIRFLGYIKPIVMAENISSLF